MNDHGTWMLTGGALATLVAIVAWLGDHRRTRRRHIDAVGFMPWTDVFFWSTMLAVLLLGAGAQAMLSA
jgi:uncharacterized membrane protein